MTAIKPRQGFQFVPALTNIRAPCDRPEDLFIERRARNQGTPLLADLLEFGLLFRSDLACVFECLDALRGQFFAVIPHAKCQQLTSKSVLVAVLPIFISTILGFLIRGLTR